MDTTINQPNPHRPFIAGLWLIAAIPATAAILLPLSAVIGNLNFEDTIVTIGFSLVHFVAGYLWARSLGRRAGLPEHRAMNIAGGIGFALFVVGGRTALVELDPFINRWLRAFRGATHLEFGALFVTWTGLVAGGSGLALGLGRRDWKLALKLLGLGLLSGGGAFLVVAFIMDLIGFRVGAPGSVAMLPTTFLGVWSAAFIGSALFGKALAQSNTA